MKICPKCIEEKPKTAFNKNKGHKDGLEFQCKECQKKYNKAYRIANADRLLKKARQWKSSNHQYCLDYSKQWVKNNPERAKANAKRWAKENLKKRKEISKKWYLLHKEKAREYTRITGARLRSTPLGKLKRNMSIMVCLSLKGRKAQRHWENVVGYTIENLKDHLQKLFQPGMTWNNYGKGGWEIDHKRPIASFNFADETEIRKCWSLKNLQPLWSHENKIKGKKFA